MIAFDRIRERKREVKLVLTRDNVNMLGMSIRNPNSMPLKEYGLKEYHCADETDVRNYMRVRKWLEQKVMGAKFKEGTEEIIDFDVKDSIEVGLKQSYVEFVQKILAHYKPVGNAASTFATSYWSLVWKLEGKTIAEDDPSEEVK